MRNIYTTQTALAIILIIWLPFSLSARKGPDISKQLVRISQTGTEKRYTGFIVSYKGKLSIICPDKAFGPGTVIRDFENNKLKLSSIIIPAKALKRTSLILILSESENNRQALLNFDNDVGKNNSKGDTVSVRGYPVNSEKIYSGTGKILAITPQKISLESKVRSDITGAPVISKKSGKVIGMAKCIKKKKVEFSSAERIDNITDFTEISYADAQQEEKDLNALSSSVIKYAKTYMALQKIIDSLGYSDKNGVKMFKHLKKEDAEEIKKKIKKLYGQLKEITKELSLQLKNSKARNEMNIPLFKSLFRAYILRAEEIIDRKCKPREELFEKILEALNNSFSL